MSERDSSTTDKAIKGVHSQTAIVAIKGIFSLIYFSIMSRLLSPDDFGFFALITAVTTILTSLSEAGLGSAVIQRKNESSEFTSTAFTLSLVLGIFFSCLLFFCSGIFSRLTTGSDILSLAYKIMSVIITLQCINNIAWSLYMRKLDFFKFGILQVFSDFFSYVTGILFAIYGFGYYAIVAAVVSNQVFLTIILIVMKKFKFKIMIDRVFVKEIIGYGGWLTAAVITRNITNEIDKIIIGRLLPIADLGALNRPQGFINRISSQINGIVDTVLFPILSSIQDDKHKISRGYLKIVSLVITFSFFLGGIISLGSKIVIEIFFGSQWLHLQLILAIFAFAMILHGYSRVADSFFRSLGIVKQYFIARLVNWFVIIIFVIIGCKFGLIGVSISLVLGTFVSCFVKFLMQKERIGVSLYDLTKVICRSVIAPMLFFLVATIIRFICPYGEFIGVFLFCILLFVSIWFFPNLYSQEFREIIISRYLRKR